jgi:hypothetical protein
VPPRAGLGGPAAAAPGDQVVTVGTMSPNACYGSTMTRADLHRLVDELPDGSLDAAALRLERVRDPMVVRLETAPPDDEPFTEEERREVYAALLRLDQGEAVPLEELMAELDEAG